MKKIVIFCISVILLLTAFSSAAFSADSEPVFSAGEVSGAAGETVTVDISVSKSSGISGLRILVDYDASKLELTGIKSADFSGMFHSPLEKNPINITWVDTVNPENTEGGVIAKLTFNILETAPNGKTELKLSYDENEVYNSNYDSVNRKFETVKFAVKNGYVDIKNAGSGKSETVSGDKPAQNSSSTGTTDKSGGADTDSGVTSTIGDTSDNTNDVAVSDNSQTDPVFAEKNSTKTLLIALAAIAAVCAVAAVTVVVVKQRKK